MRKTILVGGLAVALLGLGSGQASATALCYQEVEGTTILRLGVRRHDTHVSPSEARRTGNPRQTSYAVHGTAASADLPSTLDKAASEPTAARVELLMGTVIVASRTGARMLFANGVECTSDEASAAPSTWICGSSGGRNDLAAAKAKQLPEFRRIDPSREALCGAFGAPSNNT